MLAIHAYCGHPFLMGQDLCLTLLARWFLVRYGVCFCLLVVVYITASRLGIILFVDVRFHDAGGKKACPPLHSWFSTVCPPPLASWLLVPRLWLGFEGLIDPESLGEDGGSAVAEEMEASSPSRKGGAAAAAVGGGRGWRSSRRHCSAPLVEWKCTRFDQAMMLSKPRWRSISINSLAMHDETLVEEDVMAVWKKRTQRQKKKNNVCP